MPAVRISLDDAVLSDLVAEQLAGMAEMRRDDAAPDLVIAAMKSRFSEPHLLLGGKKEEGCESLSLPLRLGDMTDRLRYMLSGRHRFADTATILFAGFRLDARTGALSRDDPQNENGQDENGQGENGQDGKAACLLTDKEKLLILSLHAAPGRCLDRQTLLQDVWGYADTAETHTLETHLYRLRQKLDEHFQAKDLIVTRDGVYCLQA